MGRLPGVLLTRETAVVLGYYAVYMMYLFAFSRFENELTHYLTLVIGPLFLLHWIRKKSGEMLSHEEVLRSIGLSKENIRQGLGFAFMSGSLFVLLGLGLQMVYGDRSTLVQIESLASMGKLLYVVPLSFFAMLFTAGFTEEVFFRGVIQSQLSRYFNSHLRAITITSALFGLYHVPYLLMKGLSGPGALADIVGRAAIPALVGCAFGYARVRYRNLLVPIIMHAMVNMPLLILSVR